MVIHFHAVKSGYAEPEKHAPNVIFSIYRISAISPPWPKSDTISDLPAPVAQAFDEAENCYTNRIYGSAGGTYRKAVERAVRHLYPEGQGMLNRRIRALEKTTALPEALIQMMDHVKLIGNDSMHEDHDPTPEEVAAARDFTRLLLTYLFELPAQIERAAARREAQDAEVSST